MVGDPAQTNILSQLLILLVLTGINALFASAEMAMVSTNKSKIKRLADNGNKKAKLVQEFQVESTKFLSTIQIAITLAGFFSSASAATGLSEPLGTWLSNTFNISRTNEIAFITVTLLLALFTLIFGELVPKRVALHNPEGISLFSVRIIKVVSFVFTPVISFLTFCTNLVMKLIRMDEDDAVEKVTKEEIQAILKKGRAAGTLNKKEAEMINSIIEFNDQIAKEIMTPKINVFAIDNLQDIEKYLPELLDMKYSQIPVYEDDIDNIIGILRVKDFIKVGAKEGFDKVDLKSILVNPYLVPESKNVGELLKEMQLSKIHFAVLIDEFGGFAGIVSLRDLVEEVMGDLEDEEINPKIHKVDDSTYIIDGLITIDDLNEKLNLSLSSENYETLSGFLTELIGFIPKENDDPIVEQEHLVFKIESLKRKRIDKVKLYIGKDKSSDEDKSSNEDKMDELDK